MVEIQPYDGYISTVLPRTRQLAPRLTRLLELAPAVLLTGARQAGKSTLVQGLLQSGTFPGRYVNLDHLTTLAAAKGDPAGFLAELGDRVAIDEVQRSPDLLLAIKAAIDHDRSPGRFLLTGSANPLTIPAIADALVGRVRVVSLRPFSAAEIAGQATPLVDALFERRVPSRCPCWLCGFPVQATGACPLGHRVGVADSARLAERLLSGGFPEVVEGKLDGTERRDWFESYLTTVLQRVVRDITSADSAIELLRLLSVVSAESATQVNYANLSQRTGITQTTLKRYLALLESVFLVDRRPAWTKGRSGRHVHAPKLTPTDTGLMAHVQKVDAATLARDRNALGPLLEAFVVSEMAKLASVSERRPSLAHYRTSRQKEVDLVLEGPGGEIVGIEVKAASTVAGADFNGLRALEDDAGDRFGLGVVLYTGSEPVPFGHGLFALPLSVLWAAPDCFPSA